MLDKIAARLRAIGRPQAAPARAAMLDQYVHALPEAQHALDVFKGDWWSTLPPPNDGLRAGQLPLFADSRITWAIEALGGVAGRTVLELGPLEGGHTYMLEQAGAQSIVAVEASTKAFLKCLVVKEVVGLPRSRFLLGDFEEYLRAGGHRYDCAIASGVVYHVRNPVELIHNIARAADRVFIWTHYFDKARLDAIAHMRHRFQGGSHVAEHAGFRHTLHRYDYGDFLDTTRFAGGSEEYSHWLSREDLLGALRHAGFDTVTVGQEEPEHTNGPCISLVASRT
jgi:uncharacterized protein DUF1698